MQHVHLDWWLEASLYLGELDGCKSSILVSTSWHIKDLFPNLILEGLSRMLTAKKKVLFVFKNGDHLFFELATTLKNFGGQVAIRKKN